MKTASIRMVDGNKPTVTLTTVKAVTGIVALVKKASILLE